MINQYNRYFINLYQEDPHCTMNGKEAIGRCRIETKADQGKIYIWVQNLKPDIYDVYLISSNNNKCENVLIGNINTDNRGYAELNFNFNIDNIAQSNIAIEKINVVAITPKNKKSIVAMNGYKNSKIQWRNNFVVEEEKTQDSKKNDIKSEKDETVNSNESEKSTETKPENPDSFSNNNYNNEEKNTQVPPNIITKKLDNNIDSFKAIAEKISKELEELNNYKFISEEELANLKPKNPSLDFIFKNNIQMNPFEKQNKQIKWVRISLKELINLPIDFWLYANHPFILSAYYKNKHLILGNNNKNDEYILGLPDKYQPEYKNVLRKLGFVQFKCCKDKKPMKNDYGYWLAPIYF